MDEMICITCPMGCHLKIERLSENEIAVTGNKCVRGEQYAREELLSPKRVVTATCKVKMVSGAKRAAAAPAPTKAPATATFAPSPATQKDCLYRPRRVPVRTTKAFPKERIAELLTIIYGLEVELPTERGRILVADALGTGIDIVVTRSM
ncbi:MAG TPA: DUF1667 domain-containing protein [Rectinemataceae bacterium]|nr:DUF1667 domain-containing protein [Rectinemataceae bacterium]